MKNAGSAHRRPQGREPGRPSSFQEAYIDQVERLCRVGAIDTDIADFFGVHVDTVYEWKKVHPEFSEAIKRGKSLADRQVAEKLIDRAMGAHYFQQKEVKLKTVKYDKKTLRKISEEERVEVVTLEMTAPPDTAAIIFFLKNRRPDLWRDKQEITHAGDADNPLSVTQIYLPQNGRETK